MGTGIFSKAIRKRGCTSSLSYCVSSPSIHSCSFFMRPAPALLQIYLLKLLPVHDVEKIPQFGGFKDIEYRAAQVVDDHLYMRPHGAVQEFNENPDGG